MTLESTLASSNVRHIVGSRMRIVHPGQGPEQELHSPDREAGGGLGGVVDPGKSHDPGEMDGQRHGNVRSAFVLDGKKIDSVQVWRFEMQSSREIGLTLSTF